MAKLMPPGKQQYFNSAGQPLAGGRVYTYNVGTNTPRPTYSDAAGTIPNTNPIVLDARGEATVFWNGVYKIVLRDASDVVIWTVDSVDASDVSAAISSAINDVYITFAAVAGSSLIGFKQEGAGTVLSTVQKKLYEHKSVKDYGAVGDGVTNDAPAFQLAANAIAAAPNGMAMYIPAGVYRLNTQITFPNSKSFILYGDGDSSVVHLVGGAGQAVFQVGSASTYPTRQVLKDIFFRGPDGGTSSGLRMQNCNTARVEGCVFQNQVSGIILDACYAVEVISVVYDVCTLYGLVSPTTSCHNLIVKRNNFFTCGVGGGGHAINISVASDNIVIDDNDFEYCNVTLKLQDCTAVSFTRNYAEYCASSIFDFQGTCYGVEIALNWLALGTLSTTIGNVSGGSLKNNTVYNQTIGVATSCVDFIVGRNRKYGTGTLGQSSWRTPALSGTFSTQSGYAAAQYIKMENGQVQLRGNLLNGAAGSLIFNLPVGYRPALAQTFATASSAQPGLSIVEVRANGDVWCITRDTSTGTGLNGVVFDAAN